jgi:hypothetical protein
MIIKLSLLLSILVFLILLGACTPQVQEASSRDSITHCQIIYDAGSSKTRLYVYALTESGWLKHAGPKTDALADPVREIRGKSMSDVEAVVDDMIAALENIRNEGPLDNKGEPRWPAFDWREQCIVDAATVYATAGMRLAEQQNAQASEQLWKTLNDKLSGVLAMTVDARTLSGYEEGLFAWLAIREGLSDGGFGVAEMGGASVQITFPCPHCKSAKDVRVKGQVIPIFSHSFLGWGQDEAWKRLGPSPGCARGVGLEHPDWEVEECGARMTLASDLVDGIRDHVTETGDQAWYLAGAFRYMHNTDIDQYCRKGLNSGFRPKSSCFRAVYLDEVLDTLGIPEDTKPSDVDWTLGAVICTATRCLD